MKILILSDFFPPEKRDGAGIAAYRLAKEFLNSGHKVSVITICDNKQNQGFSEYDGMKIYKICSNYDLRFRSYISLWNPKIVKKLEEIIKKINPDIVHAHNIHLRLSYKSLEIAKRNSARVFLTIHDLMPVHYGKFENFFAKDCLAVNCEFNYKISVLDLIKTAGKRYNPLRNIVIKHYLKYADKIFSISDEQKKVLEANGIGNIRTIYNGINAREMEVGISEIEAFKNKYALAGHKVIFFAGRISEEKGSLAAVKAFKKIKEQVLEAKLLVAGELNQALREMKNLAEKLGVENSICFAGSLSEDSMKAAYASCDVHTAPSIYFDPFNLTNIEAMAAKKPVVGSCFGGIPEIIINNKTGFIVNPLNIDMFADKIIKLLKDPLLAKKMGEAGYERVIEKFNLKKVSAEHIRIFEKLWLM